MAVNNMTSTSKPSLLDATDIRLSTPDMSEPRKQPKYPTGLRLGLSLLALYISMFLVALDKTILATAVPQISNAFHSLQDIGWYGSSYLLTLCATQLLWGRIYTFYAPKPVFLVSILVFEVGSALCGAAPNSIAFILGRSIAGIGSAGITAGSMVIIVNSVPLEKRPVYQGLIGAVFGVATVVGPLLGGVFTEKVSWRWCFYINLPFGALSAAVVAFVLHLPERKEGEKLSLVQQLKKLDPIGTALFLPSMICLIMALQWGGTAYAWSNWRIVLLLVLFPVLLAGYVAVQMWKPETATMPMRILTQRTVAFGTFYTSTSIASMLVVTYYIPIFFQAVKGFSPLSSGLAIIPSVLALVVGTILAGGLVQRIGYPAPFMVISTILASVGVALISTWSVNVRQQAWIGYQVLFGFGLGLGMQQPSTCAQIVLPQEDIPTGVSIIFLGQNLGGAIFIGVAQSIFADTLAGKLSQIPGLNLTRKDVVAMGATQIKSMVPPEMLPVLLQSYRLAIRNTFYVGVAVACVAIVGALGVEWKSVKAGKKKVDGEPSEKQEYQGKETA
ncbi:major facilitator superfamily transporter [Polyplosphaeria fusca]|uniref:Major facilitator superfamily transporter n=1 Tax=Polyplosphaeria fusca TaxID=682080 RepID=A0A9P4QWC7_9PLEO|nr:major facilitator superfamily transporter [Polyplosphaeria fusca]